MIPVTVVSYPGFEHIKTNITTYIDRFLDGEIVAFRGANCSTQEQLDIMTMYGDILGWLPNSIDQGDPMYYETHHTQMDDVNTNSKDALMLSWHVEHVASKSEFYVGACWCMNLFKADPDSGKTIFVDMVEVFKSLSDDDQEFLLVSEVELIPQGESDYRAEKHKFIKKHLVSDNSLIRAVLNGSHRTALVAINGQTPTEQDTERFERILTFILDEVFFNEDIRYEHSWQEGDMLILDVSRMAHAVTGGFKQGERKLTGIFGIHRYV